MSIVKMHNKKTGITYVYESTSYWDKEKKQPRNTRKLIGKIDPETGEIVPTGRGTCKPLPAADAEVSVSDNMVDILKKELIEKEREISELKAQVLQLQLRCKRKDDVIERIRSLIDRDLD